jgi:Flp pilus assembly protein TadG
MALVAPLLISLLLGIVTGAVTYGRKNSMTNASREGARLGATLVADGNWAADTRARVVELAGGDLQAGDVCVALVYKSGPTDTTGTVVHDAPATCPFAAQEPALASGTAVNDCVVKVWTRRASTIETGFFSRDVVLDAAAVARYERGVGSTCSS